MHRLDRSVRSSVVCLVVALANMTAALAAVPTSITVQGKLTDAANNPISGLQSFNFKIFDASVGGTVLWPSAGGENQSLTSDADGLWVGLVGAVTPLTDTVFADTSRWLEITVAGTTLPRVRLVTGPYAHRTGTVDGATGGGVTTSLTVGPANTAGLRSLAVGGSNIAGDNSFVAGSGNNADGDNCSILGGRFNSTADALRSSIGGGEEDTIIGQWNFIGGGRRNVVNGEASFIGGGFANRSAGPHNTIAGGYQNVARTLADKSTIGGGGFNLILGSYATISGGIYDTATGTYSTVGGGNANHALGVGATVSGGTNNLAQGARSVVPGGDANRATGNYSFAAGHRARAMHHGAFVWADETDADFSSTAANQFLIRATGNVGIGTGGPNTKLTVWTPSMSGVQEGIRINNPFGFVGNGNGASLVFSQDRDPSENFINATIQGAQEVASSSGGAYLGFSTKSGTVTEKMRITGNGNVGIGTISPSQRLHIVGAALGDGIIVTGNSPGYSLQTGGGAAFGEASSAGLWSQSADSGDAVVRSRSGRKLHLQSGFGASAITIASTGNVGIGYTNSSYKLGVNGNMWVQTGLEVGGSTLIWNGLTVYGGIYGAGGCQVQWSCPSDLRLKKNIQPLQNSVDEIHKLSAIRFDWRREEFPERNFSPDNQIGLIAQEVRKVVPEAVQEDKDGYLSVDYSRLVPLLVGSIKEQQQMITDQQKRIEKLEETIRRMQP